MQDYYSADGSILIFRVKVAAVRDILPRVDVREVYLLSRTIVQPVLDAFVNCRPNVVWYILSLYERGDLHAFLLATPDLLSNVLVV